MLQFAMKGTLYPPHTHTQFHSILSHYKVVILQIFTVASKKYHTLLVHANLLSLYRVEGVQLSAGACVKKLSTSSSSSPSNEDWGDTIDSGVMGCTGEGV